MTETSAPPPTKHLVHLPIGAKIVAGVTIWGAATGTWIVLQSLSSDLAPPRSIPGLSVDAFVLTFFSLSGIAAVALLRHRRVGFWLVLLSQLPQLAYLQTGRYEYLLFSGIYAVIDYKSPYVGFSNGLASMWHIAWGLEDAGWSFGVNLVPILIIAYLRRHEAELLNGPTG